MSIPLVPQLLRSHLRELADNDQRLDSRAQFEGRDVDVEVGILANAEGSARVRMGDTIVLAGVKFQTMTPAAASRKIEKKKKKKKKKNESSSSSSFSSS